MKTAVGAQNVVAIKPDRLQSNVDRELGAPVRHWLADPTTEDIALNPDSSLWVKCEGKRWACVGEMASAQAGSLISVIAAKCNKIVNEDNPILECELPGYKARFEGFIYPMVPAPSFSIRKTAPCVYTLDDYVKALILSQRHHDVICQALVDRKNIIIAGGPGSGKTTLLNGILLKLVDLCPNDRVATIEDTLELQCRTKNVVPIHAVESVGPLRALKTCLRIRPDRIVVGEARGEEALTLLKSMNTGHPGSLATVHASSAYKALSRLERLAAETTGALRLAELVAESVNLVVFVSAERETDKYPAGRRVREVIGVHGHENGKYLTEEL